MLVIDSLIPVLFNSTFYFLLQFDLTLIWIMFYVGDLTYPPWREKDFDLNRFSYEWELLWIFEFNSNNGKYGHKRGRGVKSFPELVMIVMQQRENYPRKHIAFSSQLFNAQLLLSKHFTVQTKDAGCAKTEIIEVAK